MNFADKRTVNEGWKMGPKKSVKTSNVQICIFYDLLFVVQFMIQSKFNFIL